MNPVIRLTQNAHRETHRALTDEMRFSCVQGVIPTSSPTAKVFSVGGSALHAGQSTRLLTQQS